MTATPIKVSELKKGDMFKNKYGLFECVQPYKSKHYPAKIICLDSAVGMPYGAPVAGFKHDSTVELVSK